MEGPIPGGRLGEQGEGRVEGCLLMEGLIPQEGYQPTGGQILGNEVGHQNFQERVGGLLYPPIT